MQACGKINTVDLILRLLIGAPAAMLIAAIARSAGSLSTSGAFAAAIVGTAAVAAGWNWASLLILYFVSSTLLSRFGRSRKLERTAGMVEKPGARDARQVLANGAVFTFFALWAAWYPGLVSFFLIPAAASLAASAADTWGTEIGTLAGGTPRSILTGRKLAVGESGGVTWVGTVASLAGAAFMAAAAVALGWPRGGASLILLGGIVGSLADSIIGALLQRRSWCDACGIRTEMRIHDCGTVTRRVGGLPFVGNDLVNLVAIMLGTLAATWLMRPGIHD